MSCWTKKLLEGDLNTQCLSFSTAKLHLSCIAEVMMSWARTSFWECIFAEAPSCEWEYRRLRPKIGQVYFWGSKAVKGRHRCWSHTLAARGILSPCGFCAPPGSVCVDPVDLETSSWFNKRPLYSCCHFFHARHLPCADQNCCDLPSHLLYLDHKTSNKLGRSGLKDTLANFSSSISTNMLVSAI